MAKTPSREEWLNRFVDEARFAFTSKDFTIPAKVRVSIGFTSKGARSNHIGECWSSTSSADGTFEVFIVPSISDPSRIADILTHELVHAAVGLEAGHGPVFKKCAKAMGLTGKMTATTAGPEFHAWAKPVLEKLGAIPHAALQSGGASTTGKKQTTRMLKCVCAACDFTFRTSAKWARVSLQCPDADCGGEVLVG